MIERLCLIGVGLMGGSLALALRRRGLVREVIGVDPDPANLDTALRRGIIDAAHDGIAAGAEGADWVVIAAPVGALPAIAEALRPVWRDEVVYTDTGSTKGDVVAALARSQGRVPANFVPGHPITGAERSGAAAAVADLFENRRVILTPLESTSPAVLKRVEGMWRGVGATVTRMDPDHHDEVLAATSHLPHVLAFVLTEWLGRRDEQEEIFQYAAGGFRDFTRIASSDPRMWRDICLANRAEIVPLIEQYRDALRAVADRIDEGDGAALLQLFSAARAARQRFLDQP